MTPMHKTLDDLVTIRASTSNLARSFASCEDMARRLDAVFPGGFGDMFYALPLSRKQIICSVLSGMDKTPEDTAVLRNTLMLCSERYLLRVRFGGYDAPLHRFLADIQLRCLLLPQYDLLWDVSAVQKLKLGSFSWDGMLDASGIIANLKAHRRRQ